MKYSVLFGIMALLFVSCSDKQWVEIDSLSADGDEFFCNQKVKLWMCLKASDLPEVDYEWSCDGGKLTQPQGLDEMTWQAPGEPGTYTVNCKVKIGKKSETRQHKMYVSSYFFEKFEKTAYAWKGSSATTLSLRKEGNGNSYLMYQVKSTTEAFQYITYSFNDASLCTPFSSIAKIGWVDKFPADNITVGSKKTDNMMVYGINMNKDPNLNSAKYISRIVLNWYPVGSSQLDPEGNLFNGILRITENDNGRNNEFSYHFNSVALDFAKGEYKRTAINIDANDMIRIYIDGEMIYETGALATWRAENAYTGGFYVKDWQIGFPNGNGGNNVPTFYLDDTYAHRNETILTGE